MIKIYISNAILNLKENKLNSFFFISFLAFGLAGIIIIDSLTYSVSKKAESELKISGDNVITIKFYSPVDENKIKKIFDGRGYTLSFTKNIFLSDGVSSGSSVVVTGVDSLNKEINGVEQNKFVGDVVVVNNDRINNFSKIVYLGGVPFRVVGEVKKTKTEFLDSLGISRVNNASNYIIPIDTSMRFALDRMINSVSIIFSTTVDNNSINEVERKLKDNGMVSFNVISYLNAQHAVSAVFERFNILTNTIYIILNLSTIVIMVILCKRSFQLRTTEFALKVIHGISIKSIVKIVTIETLIVMTLSIFSAFILSLLIMLIMSNVMTIDLMIRFRMLYISVVTLTLLCFMLNVRYGKVFFTKNPIDVIHGRNV